MPSAPTAYGDGAGVDRGIETTNPKIIASAIYIKLAKVSCKHKATINEPRPENTPLILTTE